MENKINIIEKAFLLLQKIVQTRFGSALVGFVLASVLSYFIVIEGQRMTIESYREEIKDCHLSLKSANEKVYTIEKETRKEAQKEAQQYIDYAFSLIHNVRNEIPIKRDEVEQEIKQLEQKRKEVMR